MAKVTFFPTMDWMLQSPEGDVGRHLAATGRRITLAAKAKVGVKTGRLRRSIHMRHFRDTRGQYVWIGSEVNYALMHHEGTRPHLIRPNRAKILVFTKRGQVIRTSLVHHPGTRANKYLSDSLRLLR
jgi:hypothetical protein